ncbi:hypothetical protein [Winogradskyella thalassocola]|uniref:Uncharacterized protein n=1 Tax=Winogradskyella thalassocola TaxID=262004 RepID=A0A1G8GYA6_9FLAO|nr:hypothetical protein [Winogradskyella thalassocola]SDH99383.1 hypothetical protein SAMN04489796_10666 [Winogradskyella thalassocola]
MNNLIVKLLFLLFAFNMSYSQPWMTNLDIAQNLAITQNKMVLMVWEESTKYPYGVLAKDDTGKTVFIESLFESEILSPLIWEHFVPVIVSEYKYADLYEDIKDKRSQKYIDKFNDDSIKIMDVNGNILNVSSDPENFQNITTIINDYAINTEFMAPELIGYNSKKDFYSAYYLASKYLDFSMYMKDDIRSELVDLGIIYLNEATELIATEPTDDQQALTQRIALLDLQQYLILKRPKKVLRQLKKMDAESIETTNASFVAFLYYTVYKILNDETNAALWESKISSVNLKKAQLLINLNS